MRHVALSLHRNTRFPAAMADVRGFEVRTRDKDEKVGKVDDLVCAQDGRIRYLDVGVGGLFSKKRVLLPVGVARADRTNDVVWIAGMTKEQVEELPEYNGDPDAITQDYESQCCSPFRNRGAAAAGVADDVDLDDQGRLYADRGGAAARDERLSFSTTGGGGLGDTTSRSTTNGGIEQRS
jgi:hypothetical protein